MKHILKIGILVCAILLITGSAYADRVYRDAVDTATVDSVYHGGWDCLDSLIIASGTADTIMEITITGVGLFDPGDRLFLGFGNDSANRVDSATGATTGFANANLDTLEFRHPRPGGYGKAKLPFAAKYILSMAASTTDTIYFNVACWGSSYIEQVEVEDVVVSVVTHLEP